jgi:hypothetical protein
MDIFLSGGMGVKAVDHIWHFLHTMFCSYIHDFKVPGEGIFLWLILLVNGVSINLMKEAKSHKY